jgi:hypothetical protein
MTLSALGILSAAGAGGPVALGVAGYFAGGWNGTIGYTTVDKFAFPADTRTTLGTGLSAANFAFGMANSGVAGYVGMNEGAIDKFAFPSDSRSTLATTLPGTQGYCTFENRTVAGYFAAPISGRNNVEKIAFSNDARTSLGAVLAVANYYRMGLSNSSVAGYVAGGGDPHINTVEKFAFPADTRTTLAATLTATKGAGAAMSNRGVAGYVAGGGNPSGINSNVDKVAFATDTVSSLGTGLSSARHFPAGMADSGVAGYVAGGSTSGNDNNVTTVDKFAFPADTRTTLGTGLSVARSRLGGMANEGAF